VLGLVLPLALSAAACSAAPAALPAMKLVDLTHDFAQDTIYWPTESGFELTQVSHGLTDKGYWYEANRFAAAEHGGTHVDAPAHFAEHGDTVDRIPLGRLVGPAVVVDVSDAAAGDRDHLVSVGELEAFEARHGRIPDGAIVLLRTGYGAWWPDRVRYLGTDLRGAAGVAALHFPGLAPEAARWLMDQRRLRAVGIDTASIDRGVSQTFDTHVALFARGVPAFENVANLEQLPATDVTVIALPMKIRGGSGGPLRIIAMVPEGR